MNHIGLDTAVFCNGKIAAITCNLIVNPHSLRLTHLVISANSGARIAPVSSVTDLSDLGVYLKSSFNELVNFASFRQTHFSEVSMPNYDFAEFGYPYPFSGEQNWINIPAISYWTPPGGFVISRQTQMAAKNGHIGQFKELIVVP